MHRHQTPGPGAPPAPAGRPLEAGPRWYRTRIRTLGPLLGLTPMVLLGGIAWVSLQMSDATWSGVVGLIGGVSAAPGLLVAGAPLADESRYPIAIVASIPFWMVLGLIASRRATRSTIASWRDYWRELVWLTIAVVIGAGVALAVAANSLRESLLL